MMPSFSASFLKSGSATEVDVEPIKNRKIRPLQVLISTSRTLPKKFRYVTSKVVQHNDDRFIILVGLLDFYQKMSKCLLF